MAKLACVLLLVAAAACAHANRIIGGDPTTIEKYPGIVQVEDYSYFLWRQTCGANILNIRYLLSAAHCFGESIRDHRIRAGTDTRGAGGDVIYIRRVVNHPSFGLNELDGDICVVELETDLVYSDKIQPRPIPPQGFKLPGGLPVWFAGWGGTSSDGILPSPSPILRDVQVYTVDHEHCESLYADLTFPHNITENMICSGVLGVGGKGPCTRDSGGPMYYDGIIFGLVSWSLGCASAEYPAVNVAVSSYTDWIVATAV